MAGTKLIHGGMIVTADEKNTVYPEGHILIENNQIASIGKGESKESADDVIDAQGCLIIPGLITAHTHLYGILLRGASLNIEPPTDFAQILQRVWWPLDEALTIEDAYASALSASADMVRNGSNIRCFPLRLSVSGVSLCVAATMIELIRSLRMNCSGDCIRIWVMSPVVG